MELPPRMPEQLGEILHAAGIPQEQVTAFVAERPVVAVATDDVPLFVPRQPPDPVGSGAQLDGERDGDAARVPQVHVIGLPTGDPEELSGTGTTQVAPLLYAAGRPVPVGLGLTLRPYLNAGVTFDASSVDESQSQWGLGVDLGILERATIGLAVLARHPFARIGPPGAFDVPRCGALDAGGCTRGGTAPLFGLRNERVDSYQLSLGLRLNLWRDVLVGFANALIPLGDAGLRTDVIPLVGVEAAF